MIRYRVSTRYSAAEFPDFGDALELYKNQRIRGAAPVVIAITDFTVEQNEAIDRANREADAERESRDTEHFVVAT